MSLSVAEEKENCSRVRRRDGSCAAALRSVRTGPPWLPGSAMDTAASHHGVSHLHDTPKTTASAHVRELLFLGFLRRVSWFQLLHFSLIRLQLDLGSGIRHGEFHPFTPEYPFSQHLCLRDSLFSIESPWLPCQMSVNYMCLGLFLVSQFCSIGLFVCVYAGILLFTV